MPKFLVKQSFKGALRGIHVRAFVADSIIDLDDADLARVALAEGWIESWVAPVEGEDSGEKAAAAAPKNKAAKAAPKNKASKGPEIPDSSEASAE